MSYDVKCHLLALSFLGDYETKNLHSSADLKLNLADELAEEIQEVIEQFIELKHLKEKQHERGT